MWRVGLIVGAVFAAVACTTQDGEKDRAPAAPSDDPTSVIAGPATPDARPAEPRQVYEDCRALAAYFAAGGSTHDLMYDSRSDTLIIYGATGGRQFAIRSSDAECISGSPAISGRVRDAVRTHRSNVGREDPSALLEAAS